LTGRGRGDRRLPQLVLEGYWDQWLENRRRVPTRSHSFPQWLPSLAPEATPNPRRNFDVGESGHHRPKLLLWSALGCGCQPGHRRRKMTRRAGEGALREHSGLCSRRPGSCLDSGNCRSFCLVAATQRSPETLHAGNKSRNKTRSPNRAPHAAASCCMLHGSPSNPPGDEGGRGKEGGGDRRGPSQESLSGRMKDTDQSEVDHCIHAPHNVCAAGVSAKMESHPALSGLGPTAGSGSAAFSTALFTRMSRSVQQQSPEPQPSSTGKQHPTPLLSCPFHCFGFGTLRFLRSTCHQLATVSESVRSMCAKTVEGV
jgi:hypothetical protein